MNSPSNSESMPLQSQNRSANSLSSDYVTILEIMTDKGRFQIIGEKVEFQTWESMGLRMAPFVTLAPRDFGTNPVCQLLTVSPREAQLMFGSPTPVTVPVSPASRPNDGESQA